MQWAGAGLVLDLAANHELLPRQFQALMVQLILNRRYMLRGLASLENSGFTFRSGRHTSLLEIVARFMRPLIIRIAPV